MLVILILFIYWIRYSVVMTQISNIKKSLKTAHQDEEHMIVDSKEMSYPVAVGKKAVRSKPGGYVQQ